MSVGSKSGSKSKDEAAKKQDLANVLIDGVWHRFPKGMRIIEALRAAGVEVPHYCYHPKLSSPGNCRMCLVQIGMPARLQPGEKPMLDENGYQKIQWLPRPMIACANTISDNMGVNTLSELTKNCRHSVMEFLLANHPLDCPICDQAGECRLQEFSIDYGKSSSNFRENKNKKPKNSVIGKHVTLDNERCILCTRCVRFEEEVSETNLLGVVSRGSYSEIAIFPNDTLDNNYSLNTVDLCPVGALTSRDFRFQMRVWFLKDTPSICDACSRGCNINIATRENKIYRITPRRNDAVNSTWMCDYGRMRYRNLYDPQRLVSTLGKRKQELEVLNPSEAVTLSARKLRDFDGTKIGLIASARLTNEELFLCKKLMEKLQAKYIATIARPQKADKILLSSDGNPNMNGAKLILGKHIDSAHSEFAYNVQKGQIKALICVDESLDDCRLSQEDLENLELIVCLCAKNHKLAVYADFLLPTSFNQEKEGTMINASGRLQRLNSACSPPQGVNQTIQTLCDLIVELDSNFGPRSFSEIHKNMLVEQPEFVGADWQNIGDLGIEFVPKEEKIPLLEKERERIARGEING